MAAFPFLKERLIIAYILNLPHSGESFTFFSDGFTKGLGCVLMQKDRAIGYALFQLKPFQVNYLTHDLKLATVFFALKNMEA